MSASLLYHAFGIRDYEYSRTEYHDGQQKCGEHGHMSPPTLSAPACATGIKPVSRLKVQHSIQLALGAGRKRLWLLVGYAC